MKLFQLFRKAAAVKCVSDVLELLLYNRKNRMVCRNTSWKNQTSVLQWLDKLSLKLVAIDVKTSDAVPTADYINIQVDAAVNIKVGDEPQKLQKASQNFLNRDSEYIAKVAREVLEGNMREIVGKMRLEEMVSDRQKFAELEKEKCRTGPGCDGT